ncbi:MAG: sigma-54 dependent transcriptional regulator [Isosphaeraceae bacterium]|nr:sigma-54 dependent transcriptional regulator [Isosphaeraceae bacterium]
MALVHTVSPGNLQPPESISRASSRPSCRVLPCAIIGKDKKILSLLSMLERVADTAATVLITGESGTGKECVARYVYQHSSRCNAPFLAVNSGAISEGLLESELFGHAKGAFTGADLNRVGVFGAADGGTIFLDEISEMSKMCQAKLLRVLQSGEYKPVGLSENRHCDIRIIAATNEDLRPMVDSGKFRQDLYYRLNVIRLELPPLRDRKGDIPLLVAHFLRRFGEMYGKRDQRISKEAEAALLRYDFPGNVRELENVIQRAVVLCESSTISLDDLTPEILAATDTLTVRGSPISFHDAKALAIDQFERSYLTSVLHSCGGIISRAAACSGLSERNFHEKMKKYKLSWKSFRASAKRGSVTVRPSVLSPS